MVNDTAIIIITTLLPIQFHMFVTKFLTN